MEILIISKSRGAAGRLRLSGFALVLFVLAVCGSGAAAAYWGYARGSNDMSELMLNDPTRSSGIWQRQIVLQRQFLNQVRSDMDADLSALASSVGALQSDVGRLDAVAERIALSSHLDADEFAFGEPAPIGGPHPEHAAPPQWRDLLANLSALESEIAMRDSTLLAMESFLLDKQQKYETEPDGRPVPDGWVSSPYGYRTDPVTGGREFHSGVDFAGKRGMQVRAVAAGLVTWSGKRWGYGNLVELNHGNGVITRYAHNRENLVKVGEKVEKNQAIALLGSTGRSTGPHVHFEVVQNDKSVNPWKFIQRNAE